MAGKPAKPTPRARKQQPKKAAAWKEGAPLRPEAPKPTEVKVTAAKGRPMLTWVGKRPLSYVRAFPAQHVERHNALEILGIPSFDSENYEQRIQVLGDLRSQWNGKCWDRNPLPGIPVPETGGLLFHGDNKEVLAYLLANGYRGKVNLIYIDPPFDSGADYVRKVSLRGATGMGKVDGESYTLGEQIQYTDIWTNDNYLQFMYERLLLLKELLAEGGSIALHCDSRRNHYLRFLLEEVFGADNFRGEIIVRAGVKNVQAQFEEMSSLTLGCNTIFLYSKSADTKYRRLQGLTQDYEPGKWDTFWRGTDRPTMRYKFFDQTPEHGQWRWEVKRAECARGNYEQYLRETTGKVSLDDYYLSHLEKGSDLDFTRLSEDGVVQYYVPPRKYKLLSNVWLDIPYRGSETGYPTEKNEAIVGRLATWITQPGDIILDCFVGSGTAAAVAQKCGRRWIGCDINKGAIQTTAKRLRAVIGEQIKEALEAAKAAWQGELIETEEAKPKPCQFGFNVWRVNDYDLAVQHNEAVNLACEHIGIQRKRTDKYFDGTLGKSLVKIVPFNHPLSPLDLEELKRELEARPDEDRRITVVCLGMELAAQAWVEEWNRLRKGKDAVNRIEVIELRTDPKFGRFIKHEPATARVKMARKGDKLTVEVADFISPSVVERLKAQVGVVQPKIEDWRSMVDCIMIDTGYNGGVFNVTLADVPEKKDDLVVGAYELPAPGDETTVAVKIIDMLGEEILIVQAV